MHILLCTYYTHSHLETVSCCSSEIIYILLLILGSRYFYAHNCDISKVVITRKLYLKV